MLIPISIGKNLVNNLRLNGHKVTIVSRYKGAEDTITWQQLRFGQGPEDATALVNLGRDFLTKQQFFEEISISRGILN